MFRSLYSRLFLRVPKKGLVPVLMSPCLGLFDIMKKKKVWQLFQSLLGTADAGPVHSASELTEVARLMSTRSMLDSTPQRRDNLMPGMRMMSSPSLLAGIGSARRDDGPRRDANVVVDDLLQVCWIVSILFYWTRRNEQKFVAWASELLVFE